MRSLRLLLMLMFAGCWMMPIFASAKVVRVEVENREPVANGEHFGRSGTYEKITGKIYLEVDPDHPANQLIVDLDLAPRNRRGNVECSTDFELHKPLDPLWGNRRLIYFVNNRGHKVSVRQPGPAGYFRR